MMTSGNSSCTDDSNSDRSIVLRSRKWCLQLGLISIQQHQHDAYKQRIQEMRHQYQNLVDQFPFPDDGHAGNDDDIKDQHDSVQELPAATSSDNSDTFLDPLTAMVKEQESRTERLQKLDLKYRKEKAMRNRGKAMERTVEEDGDGNDPRVERSVTLQVIDKDLARLPPPPPPPTSSSPSSSSSASPVSSESSVLSEQAISKRKNILRRVLYCFHCATHPTPGYRQGMHEIASYLLHALAMEQGSNNVETISTTANKISNDGDDDDDDENDDDGLAAQVYSMLHAILMAILPAYDVSSQQHQQTSNMATSPTSSQQQQAAEQHHQVHDKNKPLEGMSRRILAQVAIHDAVLCRRLQVDLQVPAQLYLTKWIRLLYSREVASNQVLPFWDEVFELMTTTTSLMSVLETVAAARLLLWRGRLHVPPPATSSAPGQQHQQHDDHDTLHLLMNLPMETLDSTREWLQLSRQMIRYNQSRQLLWSTCVKDQPTLPLVTLPPLTAVPGVVVPSPATTAHTATTSMNTNTATSTFASARLLNPSSVFGSASSNNNNNGNSNNPLMDRFSFTSVRQNLEQTVKSTTQSIGQRLHQEWEHLAADLGGVSSAETAATAVPGGGGGIYSGVASLRANNRATGTAADAAYNITYRNDSMSLLDPPVPPGRAAATAATSTMKSNVNVIQLQQQHAAWARQLQVQTATLQSFLIQVEQEHERHHGSNLNQNHNRVPPIVWEALATLETMRLEMTNSSPHAAPSP